MMQRRSIDELQSIDDIESAEAQRRDVHDDLREAVKVLGELENLDPRQNKDAKEELDQFWEQFETLDTESTRAANTAKAQARTAAAQASKAHGRRS